MVLAEFERRLRQANPKLHIKKYGDSKAGIHLGTRFICRIGFGEIQPYNEFLLKTGMADQFKTDFNIKGYYKYKLMLKRGRMETARILYTQGLILYDDISKLTF